MSRQVLTIPDVPPTLLTQAAADLRYPLRAETDPYTQYYNQSRADARYLQISNAFTQAQADARYLPLSHAPGTDPHPQYATDVDLAAHAPGTDPHPQYATDTDLSNHAAAADPHPTYYNQARGDARYLQTTTAASTYLPLTGGTLSGNLGIGVTPNAGWASTGRVLQAGAGLALVGDTGILAATLASNAYSDGTSWRSLATGPASMVQLNAGQLIVFNAASVTGAGTALTNTERLRVTTAGTLMLSADAGAMTITTPSADLLLATPGNVGLNPTGNYVYPTRDNAISLGSANLRYVGLSAMTVEAWTLGGGGGEVRVHDRRAGSETQYASWYRAVAAGGILLYEQPRGQNIFQVDGYGNGSFGQGMPPVPTDTGHTTVRVGYGGTLMGNSVSGPDTMWMSGMYYDGQWKSSGANAAMLWMDGNGAFNVYANTGLSNGAVFTPRRNLIIDSNGSATHTMVTGSSFYITFNSTNTRLGTNIGNIEMTAQAGYWHPATDNSIHLGATNPLRFIDVCAVNGTIQTSDPAMKLAIVPVDPDEALAEVLRVDVIAYELPWPDTDDPDATMAHVGFDASTAPDRLRVRRTRRGVTETSLDVEPNTTASIGLAAIQALARRVAALEAQPRV